MRKYLKRKNKAVAFIAIALMLCTLCALPISASSDSEWVEMEKDNNGFYPALQSISGTYRLYFSREDKGGFATFCYLKADGSTSTGYAGISFDCVGDNTNMRQLMIEADCEAEYNVLFSHKWKPKEDAVAYMKLYIEAPKIADTPSTLVGEMFTSFRTVIDGLTDGIKGMFNNILWVDGTASSGLSHFAKFGFAMAGLSLALGLGYVIISKIGR